MNKGSDHLIRNLDRISPENSVFNYKSGRNALLALGQENIDQWLEILILKIRIILEQKILVSLIVIQYLIET